jgi:glycosyltransferase involved in cell wall biosynthesis
VDPAQFRPGPSERARLGVPEGAPVVLTVSALIDSKRVIEGMEAVARVAGAHMVVAGDGPLRDELDRRAAAAMPGRFRRVSVPREEMPALYRSADVMLHMSQDEPSSVAYMEALATGLPIVTHDRDVTRWTFEGNAVLVDTDDLDLVAGALRSTLARTPVERERARAASLALVERRFSWARIAGQYADFLREVLAAQAAARGGAP